MIVANCRSPLGRFFLSTLSYTHRPGQYVQELAQHDMQSRIRTMRSPTPQLVVSLLIVLVGCHSNPCAARTPDLKEQLEEAQDFHEFAAEPGKAALKAVESYSKAAIDPNKDCLNKFPKLDYKAITSVCKPEAPASKQCCTAFNKFACQFRSQVNDFNTICPVVFMAYLNYAGGYQDGYFIGTCIDGRKGLCV